MTVSGQRTFEHWKFPRPVSWTALEESGVPTAGLVFLSKQFREEKEPFRRLHLFPRDILASERDLIISEGVREEDLNLEVVWQDAFALVVNKPAAMKVHPNDASEQNTLLQLLQKQYLRENNLLDRLRHIHRLDEATQGLVLFATCSYSQFVLDAMMREKQIDRSYLAWVDGKPATVKGTIDAPIGRDRNHPTRRIVSKQGQSAVTHYEILDHHHNRSLLRLRLETGRTHQIRVHLKHIGIPIVNDPLYGKDAEKSIVFKSNTAMKNMKLLADQLEFIHPWTGEMVRVEIGAPDSFHLF